MNIIVTIIRVLFGLFGAFVLFVGGSTLLRVFHILPGVTPNGALMFGVIGAVIGVVLVFSNLRNARLALIADGAVAILMGGIWFLQGLRMFPGQSFMNGDLKWSVIGGILALVGLGLIVIGMRRPAA